MICEDSVITVTISSWNLMLTFKMRNQRTNNPHEFIISVHTLLYWYKVRYFQTRFPRESWGFWFSFPFFPGWEYVLSLMERAVELQEHKLNFNAGDNEISLSWQKWPFGFCFGVFEPYFLPVPFEHIARVSPPLPPCSRASQNKCLSQSSNLCCQREKQRRWRRWPLHHPVWLSVVERNILELWCLGIILT